jgi:hypothetical protein
LRGELGGGVVESSENGGEDQGDLGEYDRAGFVFGHGHAFYRPIFASRST